MVARIDVISETGHKHAGEVNALAFDGEHLYSGSADGVISVWDKNLKFSREIAIHKDFSVLALAVNDHKQLYSSGRDGSLRYFRRPWSHDYNDIMLQTVMDDVTSLHIAENILYSGDDKGIITKWYHNQVGAQYNIHEEIRAMAVEGTNLYTVRETDVVITDITPHSMTQVTKGTFPGRYPLLLTGRVIVRRPSSIAPPVQPVPIHKKWVVCATRDGKGIVVASNDTYKIIATKENAHTMIINAMCATDEFLYTAGFDGKVKKWKNFETAPELVEEIDTGKCINTMVCGPDDIVFVGDSEGFVKRVAFTVPETLEVE